MSTFRLENQRISIPINSEVNAIINMTTAASRYVHQRTGNVWVDLFNENVRGIKNERISELESQLNKLRAKSEADPSNLALAAKVNNLTVGIRISRSAGNLTEVKNLVIDAFNNGELRDTKNRATGQSAKIKEYKNVSNAPTNTGSPAYEGIDIFGNLLNARGLGTSDFSTVPGEPNSNARTPNLRNIRVPGRGR
jgi:hypothetical protein